MKILLLVFALVIASNAQQPTFGSYAANVMYCGQFSVINSTNTAINGTKYYNASYVQMYYNGGDANNASLPKFTSGGPTPRVALSYMGMKQIEPADTNVAIGFDVNVINVNWQSFEAEFNIFGGNLIYLHYMYMATTNTDYTISFFSQPFTEGQSKYEVDLGYTPYGTYGTNKIQMKGFLVGYKYKPKTSGGLFLNFSVAIKSQDTFTITVETVQTAHVQKIWFYTISYDRTAIQKKDNYIHNFRDVYYQLVNGRHTQTYVDHAFHVFQTTQFKYRNFLMGTNKINMPLNDVTAIQFYLYYSFGVRWPYQLGKNPSFEPTFFLQNPANANYMYGEVFHHNTATCPSGSFYLPKTRLCVSECPKIGYIQSADANKCIPCDQACKTCSAPYSRSSCLQCHDGYLPVSDEPPLTCYKLDRNCKYVDRSIYNYIKCIQCHEGYHLDPQLNRCVLWVQLCAQYLQTGFCLRCIPGYGLVDNACVIKGQGCLIPNRDGTCAKCQTTRNLNAEGKCVQTSITCSEGQYRNSAGNCQPGTVQNCYRYNSDGACLECNQNYRFTQDLSTCERRPRTYDQPCPENTDQVLYIRNVLGQCISVQIRCKNFNQDGSCYECKENHYLSQGKCYHYNF